MAAVTTRVGQKHHVLTTLSGNRRLMSCLWQNEAIVALPNSTCFMTIERLHALESSINAVE